ncbi:ankyrin [Peniophora sp. CONT]|nr:ankyrin [Peniophora sp. CONT]
MASALKNIWVAASDGDLARVQHLIEVEGMSPNVPDAYTYTPMHAAASYGHLEVLEYLVSHGGDVNVTDDDGDTPLYTVENVETATWLVQHGAVVERQNSEGVSPADHLEEDFPDISSYLRSLSTAASNDDDASAALAGPQPSQHAQEAASALLTDNLLARASDIVAQAEAEGRDPEAELREVVGEAVLAGMRAGYGFAGDMDAGQEGPGDAKRTRREGE